MYLIDKLTEQLTRLEDSGFCQALIYQDSMAVETLGENFAGQIKAQMPEATKVTTAEVDEDTAKDIAEEAKKAEGEQPAG